MTGGSAENEPKGYAEVRSRLEEAWMRGGKGNEFTRRELDEVLTQLASLRPQVDFTIRVSEQIFDLLKSAATGVVENAQAESAAYGQAAAAAKTALGQLAAWWRASTDQPAETRAAGILEWIAKRVPKRIDTEEIGDALEKIHRLVAEGQPRWVIYLTVARACVAVLRHTLRHGAEQLLGIVMKFTAGPGDDKK